MLRDFFWEFPCSLTHKKGLNSIKISFHYVFFFFSANARAPPEPYYGRYVGIFTDFAHGIKVSLMSGDNANDYKNRMSQLLGNHLCGWWVDTFHQRFCIWWHRTGRILLGRQFTTAQSWRLYNTVSRRVQWTVSDCTFPFIIQPNRFFPRNQIAVKPV